MPEQEQNATHVREKTCELHRRQLATQLSAVRETFCLKLDAVRTLAEGNKRTLSRMEPQLTTIMESMARTEAYCAGREAAEERAYSDDWDRARRGDGMDLERKRLVSEEARKWIKLILGLLLALGTMLGAGALGGSMSAPDKEEAKVEVLEAAKEIAREIMKETGKKPRRPPEP